MVECLVEIKECVGLGCRRAVTAHAPRLVTGSYGCPCPPTPRLRAPQAVVEKSRILRYPLLLRMLRAPRLVTGSYGCPRPPTPRFRAAQAVVEKSRILRYPLLLRMLRAPQLASEFLWVSVSANSLSANSALSRCAGGCREIAHSALFKMKFGIKKLKIEN